MSEQQPGTPPDGGTPAAPPAPPAPGGGAPTPFVVSKDEWVDSRREIRNVKETLGTLAATLAKLAPVAPPPPSDDKGKGSPGPTVDADVRARLDLADAIDESGLTLTQANKQLVKRLHSAERPTDVRAWLAETVKILPVVPAATAAPMVSPPAAPGDTGPPSATPAAGGQLPENPLLWPPDVVRKTPLEEYRKALAEYDARAGKGDPLKALRRRR